MSRSASYRALAYAAADSPKVNAPRSRLTEWDALVRNPLLWLGAADPLDTQAELRATDPVREALVAMLTAWRDAIGNEPISVAAAVKAATATGMSARPQLLEALLAVAGERGEVNVRRLGRYLTRNRPNIIRVSKLTKVFKTSVSSATKVV